MALFDMIAKGYDSWYDTAMGSFVDKVETELAMGMLSIKPGMKVLDIGCGTGNFSMKLAQVGCIVTGIDISDSMLDIAREKADKEKLDIEYLNMDAYNLMFDDNSFDMVFSMAAFEFINDTQIAFDEMLRVAKPGAQLLIGTIHADSSWGRLYMSEEVRENSVFRYASFKTIEDLTTLKGARLINKGECLFIPPDTPEEDISMEKEAELSKTEGGGYICVLWQK
ncbi:MAG: class I SAM-dependent methyltransferase [Bacillota bacterium]